MKKHLPVVPKELPCDPCVHGSPCCKYGAMLLPSEAEHLAKKFGKDTVVFQTGSLRKDHWDLPPGGGQVPSGENIWSTQTVDGHCVFLKDNQCMIHNTVDYPLRCLLYPYEDYFRGTSDPPSDAVLCPEVKK